MLGEGFDMQGLLAQAQAMQQQLQAAQETLATTTVVGTAGGGLVKVTMTGTGRFVAVEIQPEACDPDDTESLGDLIVAAAWDAQAKADALAQATMPALPPMGL